MFQLRLRAAVEDFISEGAAPAERMIRDLVDCEHAYINTDHPQFIGGNRALSQVGASALYADHSAEHLPCDKSADQCMFACPSRSVGVQERQNSPISHVSAAVMWLQLLLLLISLTEHRWLPQHLQLRSRKVLLAV